MTRWTWAAWVLAAAMGCGGGGGGGVEQRDGASAVPNEWRAGDMLAIAIVDWVTRDPATLAPGGCSFLSQIAIAADDGGLPFSAEDGACITTFQEDFSGLEAQLAPSCAGAITLRLGGSSRSVTICDAERHPGPIDLDCGDVEGAGTVRITSGPDERDGDVVTALDLSVQVAPVSTIIGPESQGDGTALWPSGDLVVRWAEAGSFSGEAPEVSVEITLRRRSGVGEAVRCFVDDDGEFTVPASLLGALRRDTATLEVARVTQRRGDADGFDFRLSSRTSHAIQLFVGASP